MTYRSIDSEGLPSRALGLIWKPRTVFTGLGRSHPPWLDALVLCVILAGMSSWLFWRSDRIVELRHEKRIEVIERFRTQLSESAIQSLLSSRRQDAESLARGMALRAAFSVVASAWVIAVVVHFVGGIAYLKPDVSFRHIMSVVSHSLILVAFMQGMMFMIRFYASSIDMQPTLASLFRYIPWDAGGRLTSSIAAVNVIVLVWLGLLAAGIAAAYNQRQWLPIAAVFWSFYVIASIGFSSLPVLSDLFRHGPRI